MRYLKVKRKINNDVWIAAFLIALAGYFLFYECNQLPEGAQIYPKVIFSIFLFLSIILLIQGIVKNFTANPEKKAGTEGAVTLAIIKYPILVFLITLGSLIIFKCIGVYIAVPVFVFALMLLYRRRNVLPMVLLAGGLDLFVYLIFHLIFKLHFPGLF